MVLDHVKVAMYIKRVPLTAGLHMQQRGTANSKLRTQRMTHKSPWQLGNRMYSSAIQSMGASSARHTCWPLNELKAFLTWLTSSTEAMTMLAGMAMLHSRDNALSFRHTCQKLKAHPSPRAAVSHMFGF